MVRKHRTTNVSSNECVQNQAAVLNSKAAVPEAHVSPRLPEALKEQGNAALRSGDAARAEKLYSNALLKAHAGAKATTLCAPFHASPDGDTSAIVTLLNNRATARLAMRRWECAAEDASAALSMSPGNGKALFRLARARAAQCRWAEAVHACRCASAACSKGDAASRAAANDLFTDVATASALAGSDAAFDRRTLRVRNAGPDPWLGRIAPPTPEEEAQERGALPPSPAAQLLLTLSSGAEVRDGGAVVARAQASADAAPVRPQSFRSLQLALAAAADGDRIVMEFGIHNAAAAVADVGVRVMIVGEGKLGDTILEQRANTPLLRLSAGCVVRGMELDLCGFGEAVSVVGRAAPVLRACRIRCSGSHALVAADASRPTLVECTLSSGDGCGLLALGSSSATAERTTFIDCATQGVCAAESARVQLRGCRVERSGAEGCVAMDKSILTMHATTLTANAGPAVDVSGRASIAMHSGCSAIGNMGGGILLWDRSCANLVDCTLVGGARHALLADVDTQPRLRGCVVEGGTLFVGAEPVQQVALTDPSLRNTIRPGKEVATLPPEEGWAKMEPAKFF